MKKLNTFIRLILLLTLVIGCDKNKKSPYKTIKMGAIKDSISIEIDKKIAIKNFCSFFKKQELIKLETTEASLVSSIAKIVKHKDNIYVFDWHTDYSVLCFNGKGKFKFKLKKLGKGPHEYFDYNYGDINDYTGDIELLANGHRHLIVYDSLGNFKEKIKIPYSSNSFCSLKDKRYFYKGYIENKEEDFNFRLYSTDNKCKNILAKYLPYKVSKDPEASSGYVYGFSKVKKGEYRFVEAFNDTIYKIDTTSFSSLYKLTFNGYERNKPYDFMYNNNKFGKKREWARKLKIPNLKTFYEFKDYIAGSYITNLEKSAYIKYFIYDKKNKTTLYNGYGVSFSNQISVSISEILPKITLNGMPATHISPDRIERSIKNLAIDLLYKNKKEEVRETLRSYFDYDGNITANPYIITYKPEKNEDK
ncbi:6-bladed beta-propeller [Flavivirga rizhaonensis]|uniref:6-bladed beta-propeller n=1 Tax=Flavivirga rizhaonensis TaxID=2559571 RepID=A0A4V3P500_9FLAO|nr:6-bladed beta-propeller [Flavivirga rizhaonensis]TGV03434.1 6-bladed beta-propeller [Flavivirga rizhaonensis]